MHNLEWLTLDLDLFGVSGGVHVFVVEVVQHEAIRPVLDDDLWNALLSDKVPEAMFEQSNGDHPGCLRRLLGKAWLEAFETKHCSLWAGGRLHVPFRLYIVRDIEAEPSAFKLAVLGEHRVDPHLLECLQPHQAPYAAAASLSFPQTVEGSKGLPVVFGEADAIVRDLEPRDPLSRAAFPLELERGLQRSDHPHCDLV